MPIGLVSDLIHKMQHGEFTKRGEGLRYITIVQIVDVQRIPEKLATLASS